MAVAQSGAVDRRDSILAVLATFDTEGRAEVSLPELMECFARLGRKLNLDYEFSKKFVYSQHLLGDMDELQQSAYLRRITYRYDAFLPKRYVTLSPLGRGRAKKVVEGLPAEMKMVIAQCVEYAMKEQDERWKVWARPREAS